MTYGKKETLASVPHGHDGHAAFVVRAKEVPFEVEAVHLYGTRKEVIVKVQGAIVSWFWDNLRELKPVNVGENEKVHRFA